MIDEIKREMREKVFDYQCSSEKCRDHSHLLGLLSNVVSCVFPVLTLVITYVSDDIMPTCVIFIYDCPIN
jgi:hypothetical protein